MSSAPCKDSARTGSRVKGSAISVIIPTIGRPDSLARLLMSLGAQTLVPDEIIIADGSESTETEMMLNQSCWAEMGLTVQRIVVTPPNAVRQREAAIAAACGEFLALLDDDVVLEPECLQHLFSTILADESVVAVTADFNNESWGEPTTLWRFYLKYVLGMDNKQWQGKVVGPLLRFGYNPVPATPQPMEWLGTCNSIVRRRSYDHVGGFSDFFLRRCTMNEDVDLGIKLSRVGKLLFCPAARLAHNHAPAGRVSIRDAAEDDLYNRYFIFRRTFSYSRLHSVALVFLYFTIETSGSLLGCVYRLNFHGFMERFLGRVRALCSIAISK